MRYPPHVAHKQCSTVNARCFNTTLSVFSYSLFKDVNSKQDHKVYYFSN